VIEVTIDECRELPCSVIQGLMEINLLIILSSEDKEVRLRC